MEVTISTKYQIVIPKEVRRRLKLKPGQRVTIGSVTDTSLTVTKPLAAEELINKYAGIMKNTPWQRTDTDAADWIRHERDTEWQ